MRLCLMAQPSTIEIYYRVQSQQLLFLLHIIYQFVSGARPRQQKTNNLFWVSSHSGPRQTETRDSKMTSGDSNAGSRPK